MWSIVESSKDVMPDFVIRMRFELQDGQGFSFGKISGAEISLYWWLFRTLLLQQEGCLGSRIFVQPKCYNYTMLTFCMHIKNL